MGLRARGGAARRTGDTHTAAERRLATRRDSAAYRGSAAWRPASPGGSGVGREGGAAPTTRRPVFPTWPRPQCSGPSGQRTWRQPGHTDFGWSGVSAPALAAGPPPVGARPGRAPPSRHRQGRGGGGCQACGRRLYIWLGQVHGASVAAPVARACRAPRFRAARGIRRPGRRLVATDGRGVRLVLVLVLVIRY